MWNESKLDKERSEQKMSSWTDWKLNDIIWGIIIPLIVAFVIIIFPLELAPILLEVDPSYTLNAIIVDGLGEAILTVGIPLFAGLIWNKFAGGAAGFLLGSIYALFSNDSIVWGIAEGWYAPTGMFAADIANLGYVVSAMLIGYMAGALNGGSYSFRRMLVASLIAAVICGVFQLWTASLSITNMVTDFAYSGFLIILPKLIYAVIIPIFVTVFGWFGISPRQMT
jgi:hypothetical protein